MLTCWQHVGYRSMFKSMHLIRGLSWSSELPSGTSAASPPLSKACHAVDHFSNPFDNTSDGFTRFPYVLRHFQDPKTEVDDGKNKKRLDDDLVLTYFQDLN
jgi:hypothetical protein